MAVALSVGGVVAVTTSVGGGLRLKQQQEWSRVSCCSFRGVKSTEVVGLFAKQQEQRKCVVKASGEGVETEVETESGAGGVFPADQWPDTFGFLNYEDLHAHYEPKLFKTEAQPGTFLGELMSKTLYTATKEQTLAEVDHYFKEISGIPVVSDDFVVIGVLSRKDRNKASQGMNSKVKEVMTSPAITLSADKTVQDAAVLMLKNKIHRIPVVNSENQVVGIVTRTDIFTALDGKPE